MTTSDNDMGEGLPKLPAFTVPPRKKTADTAPVVPPAASVPPPAKIPAAVRPQEFKSVQDAKDRMNGGGLPSRPVRPEPKDDAPANPGASSLLSKAAVYASAPAPKPVVPYSPANVVERSEQLDPSNPASKAFLFKLLDDCGDNGVSDLHVHPGDGMWRLTQGRLIKDESANSVLREADILTWITHSDGYEKLKLASPEDLFGNVGHTTVAFGTGKWRVRGSFRRSTVGVSCTFRMIPAKIPTTDDVYLPEVLKDMVRRPSGLILIEGPTGSGKTTSIAALIDQINTETDQHIYSVEDPIEFHHKAKGNTVFTMREIGVHASNYHSAVENALRSKPNVIFVGEMLDNDTKKAALHAATTGHLVITTAHAGSVAEALDSFIGGFSADEQPQIRGRLSQSLLGVMCQKLVPKKDGNLVAAREVLLNNINFTELIQNAKTGMLGSQLESDTAGSFSLEKDLLRLIQEGVIELDVGLRNAKNLKALEDDLVYKGLMSRSD